MRRREKLKMAGACIRSERRKETLDIAGGCVKNEGRSRGRGNLGIEFVSAVSTPREAEPRQIGASWLEVLLAYFIAQPA